VPREPIRIDVMLACKLFQWLEGQLTRGKDRNFLADRVWAVSGAQTVSAGRAVSVPMSRRGGRSPVVRRRGGVMPRSGPVIPGKIFGVQISSPSMFIRSITH
jgi:hypothetical protein